MKKLLKHVEKENLCSIDDRQNCKKILKQFAIDKLMKLCEEDLKYFSSILPLLDWIYELREDDFTKQAAASLKKEITIVIANQHRNFSSSFNYVLRKREAPLVLHIGTDFFSDSKSLKHFFKDLGITVAQQKNIKVSLNQGVIFLFLWHFLSKKHTCNRCS